MNRSTIRDLIVEQNLANHSFVIILTGLNQCKLLSCNYGQECNIDKQGITNCVCNQLCEPIVRPVCANDGNTYDNLCEMQKHGCQNRLNLSAKYFGICGKASYV